MTQYQCLTLNPKCEGWTSSLYLIIVKLIQLDWLYWISCNLELYTNGRLLFIVTWIQQWFTLNSKSNGWSCLLHLIIIRTILHTQT